MLPISPSVILVSSDMGTVGVGREVLGLAVVEFGADWLEEVGGVARTDWSSSFAEYHCPFSAR